MPDFQKIISLGDLLSSVRSTADGMFDLVREPIRQGCGLNIGYSPGIRAPHALDPGFDLNTFKNLANNENQLLPEDLWSATFHSMPKIAIDYLFEHIPSSALILCCDMPPWLKKSCELNNNNYLDLRYSPLNFGSDLYIAINTNNKKIRQRLINFSILSEELSLEAALLSANVRAHQNRLKESHRHQPTNLDGTLIYIPQHPRDKSLISESGQFLTTKEFAEEIITKSLNKRVLVLTDYSSAVKLDAANRDRILLREITKQPVNSCTQNSYQILSSHEDIEIISINSPLNQEAKWFEKKSHNLHPPFTALESDNYSQKNSYLQVHFQEIIKPYFWQQLINPESKNPVIFDLPYNDRHYGRGMLDKWEDYEKVINWERPLPHGGFIRSGGLVVKKRLDDLEARLMENSNKTIKINTTNNSMQSRIQSLKDTKKGKTAYLLGNAPSLMDLNINELMLHESFWFNKSFTLKDIGFNFSPKYYFMRDVAGIQMWLDDVASIKSEIKFFGREAYSLLEKTNPDYLLDQNIIALDVINTPGKWMFEDENNFSYDPSQSLYSGFTSVLDAVQVAYYMGYSEVLIGGVDLDYSKPYFYGDIPANINGTQDWITERMRKSFVIARKNFEKNNRTLAKITKSPHLPLDYIEPLEILKNPSTKNKK